MATNNKFVDIAKFARGSRAIDTQKAEINLVLKHFRAYFTQLADSLLDERRDARQFHITVATEQDGRFTLEFAVSRLDGWYPDGYSIAAYKAGNAPSAIIASTKAGACAQSLPPEQVAICHKLVGQLIERLFEKYPPCDSVYETLNIFYEAADSAS